MARFVNRWRRELYSGMSPACPSGSVERPAWAVGAVAWFAGLEISVGLAGMWSGRGDPGWLGVNTSRAFPALPDVVVCCPGGGRPVLWAGWPGGPFPGKVSFRVVERV